MRRPKEKSPHIRACALVDVEDAVDRHGEEYSEVPVRRPDIKAYGDRAAAYEAERFYRFD